MFLSALWDSSNTFRFLSRLTLPESPVIHGLSPGYPTPRNIAALWQREAFCVRGCNEAHLELRGRRLACLTPYTFRMCRECYEWCTDVAYSVYGITFSSNKINIIFLKECHWLGKQSDCSFHRWGLFCGRLNRRCWSQFSIGFLNVR